MKYKNSLIFLLITLAGSAQAISFRDYYQSHEKEVNAAVAAGSLHLNNKELTDLIGFDEIPGITALEELRLDDNKLTTLTENIFHGLTHLMLLELTHNELATLPENIFHGLTSLRWLFLANNQFSELPENIFGGLNELEDLNLYNNHLTTLPANIFHDLHALKRLHLEVNQLAALPNNIFHGLVSLETLNLNGNQLTTFQENTFYDLTALRDLSLWNNPIPLTEAQLRKKLHLPHKVEYVELLFKTEDQEQEEQELFAGIGIANISAVRQAIDDIKTGKVNGPLFSKIAISKIRNAKGDNLLHAAIRDAAERIKVIDGMSVGLPEDEKKAVKEVQAEQKAEINDRYMKIISAILSCGEECVQDMLFTSNAEGQQVVDSVVAKLGFDSPIYIAILVGLNQEEKTTPKEEKEKNEAQK